MKDTSRSAGYIMRQDILDELGIDASTIEDYDDVHDVLVQVHEAYADERAGFPRDWQFRVPRRLFLPIRPTFQKNRIDAEASPGPSPFFPWYNGKIGFSP